LLSCRMGKRMSGKALGGLIGGIGAVLLGGGGLGIVASQHVEKVRPNTFVSGVPVGGLTQSEAMAKIDAWFNKTASAPLNLVSVNLENQPKVTAKELGAKIDAPRTMSRLPLDSFWEETSRQVARAETPKLDLLPVFTFDEKKLESLADFIDENMKKGSPARANFVGGRVVHVAETPGMQLDPASFSDSVASAMLTGQKEELVLIVAPKKVPDEDLKTIKTVEGSYTTKFNPGDRQRTANIRLAARIIDGMVLMPGERFSFNRRVGRRTSSGGFQKAGVFVNGRKDYDIGGGICQVSTTLYNAALLADLKVVSRSSHSRPVPYVPLGRDAAVSFPNPDLIIENNQPLPIAFSASVAGGQITFRILGDEKLDQTVTIVAGKATSKDNGVRYVQDDTLGYGVEKVIESGAARRLVNTYRVVTKGGVEVRREPLGQSFYAGTPRIIARNTKAQPSVKPPSSIGAGEESAGAPVAPAAEAPLVSPRPTPLPQGPAAGSDPASRP
jgi:vancomycin resistance protein YoaR